MKGKGIDQQCAVDLMIGAIGRLLTKLGEFLKQEHNLQASMKQDIESLETQLRRMDIALYKMPQAQQDQLDTWDDKHYYHAYELRELSYDTEDSVDHLLLLVNKVSEPIAKQDSLRETLENIKVRVENLAAWHAGNFVPTTTSIVNPCLEDTFKQQARQLVGIHKLKAGLISRMSLSSRQLKIVSIWGTGGMGKTTLAKAIYDSIKGEFNCSAFVFVGQQPDVKKALRDILIGLAMESYNDLNMTMLNEGQLINELQHFLENKRFLIVVDDIRNIPSWEVIKCALVDNGCGSRIIITSRALGATESSGEALKVMPLSIDDSKELFYATLYGHKGTVNFDPLDEQSTEYIVQKCACVPLAIIMIASLLAGKPQEEWTEVYNSIGFCQEDNIGAESNTRNVIQFSYYDLPSHLKTCLLYLSVFPDGHVIEKDMLVWRWVAEGFVHDDQEHGESVFKVGERYLYELVSRSMIQLVVESEDTNICVCVVEGMVMNWIRTVSKEEQTVTVLSGDWCDQDEHQSNNAPIMAIQNSALDKYHDLARMWEPKVWSFNGIGCHINSSISLFAHCQVLRVLSLEGCKLTVDCCYALKNLIVGLLHLRYLGLGGMDIRDLRIEVGHLRWLQTLELTDTNIGALPHGVTQLRQLKCLRCVSPSIYLPKDMGNLTSLEELCLERVIGEELNFFGKELSKLKELRVLRIHTQYVLGGTWNEALLQSLSKLQKIEVVELRHMGLPKTLTFLERLQVLSQVRCWRHAIAPSAFPKLRYMKMNTWPISVPGAMSRLKSVELEVPVRALKDANFDFYEFYKLSYHRLLEKAHVGVNFWDAKTEEVEEAEAALRHAVQSHPNRPKLILNRVDRCVDDKQILISLRGLLGSQLAQAMPLELLREITNDFSEKQRLGSGTFGTVYKGILLDGKEVAVKLLHSLAQELDYEEEFMKEFENLRRLNHHNIVQLLGYCYEIKRICVEYGGRFVLADKIYRALCFDYMHNGSLQRHLDDKVNRPDWPTCYKIIKGSCEGLKYLHVGLETPMYHLDLKPGNILLDKNMVPKIADFGLSKLVCNNETRATSNFLGTKRYCPPEYIDQGYVSNKFDIFSLGVVMIEIIAGPEGYCKAAEMSSQEFIDHVQKDWRKRLEETPGCTSLSYECCQVKRCIEIALDCVSADRKQRPNIGDITSWLNEIENNTEK